MFFFVTSLKIWISVFFNIWYVKVAVPDKMVGMIIGKGGEQITRLQQESGNSSSIHMKYSNEPLARSSYIELKG